MTRRRNPFRPSFGTTPPLLVGRESMATAFGDALDNGPGDPGLATLYTGARGIGKTVMLNEAESQAKERGWIVLSETATPQMLTRMVAEGLPYLARLLEFPDVERRITGVTLPGLGGGVSGTAVPVNRAAAGLRTQINALTDHLAAHETGLLITVDEIHGAQKEDLREVCAVIQHCFREERPVAFAAAGLPGAVEDLLGDKVLTFLRRADRHHLEPVAVADVSDALARPIEATGRSITSDALAVAAEATRGYPFLIQLIGHWIWRTEPDKARIDTRQARAGIEAARDRLGTLLHQPTLNDCSDRDRAFLAAMARDEAGTSKMGDIAARMGVDRRYASTYRERLIRADIIRPVTRGRVEFAVPYLGDYLRAHADRYGL